jgi:hypothetical protein
MCERVILRKTYLASDAGQWRHEKTLCPSFRDDDLHPKAAADKLGAAVAAPNAFKGLSSRAFKSDSRRTDCP